MDGAAWSPKGSGITPMTVVKKAPDIAMKTTQELIPSLKPVYDRYKFGDIFKSAFGSDHGITSSKFWRRLRWLQRDINIENFFCLKI